MMVIKCELSLPVWIWSSQDTFSPPDLTIKISSHLHAKAQITGELTAINDLSLPRYKSYFVVKHIDYTITNSRQSDYPINQTFEKLTEHLGLDILKVHNRTVEVLRGRLKGWQLNPIESPKDFRTYLSGWKTRYRKGDRGVFATYKFSTEGGLKGLIAAYQQGSFPQNLHFDQPQIDDISEWLEENKPITVTEQLLVQAIEAARSNNLRLAILNYMTALEQVLSEYLGKIINQKLGKELNGRVKSFLKSDNTRFEDKLHVILPLVIHKSWLRAIDLKKIEIAIRARNKIAHGETVTVVDRFPNIDWEDIFGNIRSLVESLTSAALLTEAGPEIRAMSELFHTKYNLYPNIWVHEQHKVSSDVTLYIGDPRDESTLKSMAITLSEKRSEQDKRFQPNKHLTISFYEFPKKRYATWKANKVTFTDNASTGDRAS